MVRQAKLESEAGGEFFGKERMDAPGEGRAREAASGGTPGSGSSAFLFLFSFALTGGGAALIAAPDFSWQVVKIGRTLSTFGIEGGSLVLVGLLFFGMACLARSLAAVARRQVTEEPERGDSELVLVADQLTTDSAQVLSSLLQMSEELGSLGEGQRAILSSTLATRESAASAQEAPAPELHEQNAVFRLAASVDQLNALLNERLHEFDLQLRSRFDSLSGSVHDTRASVESSLAKLAQRQPSTTAAESPRATADGNAAPFDEPAPAIPSATEDVPDPFSDQALGLDEPSVDFFDVLGETSPDLDEADGMGEPQFDAMESLDKLDQLLPDDSVRRMSGNE